MRGSERGWQRRWVEAGERMLGLVEAPDQELAPNLEIARMRGVHTVAMFLERAPRCVERLRWPAQVARDKGDLGFGDDTSGAGHRLFGTKGARRATQQSLCTCELAKLRHSNAAKRKCWWVLAQGNAVQGAEGIASGECTRCRRDQRIHMNPATLVTLSIRVWSLMYLTNSPYL